MEIDRNVIKNIDETKYLATENTWRYRAISRIVYENYEKMKYWLYLKEILKEEDDLELLEPKKEIDILLRARKEIN